MNIEEVEAPQKYQNLQTKPVLDPFKSTAEHRKVRELPRKMNIEEVEEPETTKIYRPNPLPSVAATPKLRKFTDETNIQARNHENSDEICAQPVRHLDLATPAFTTTVRTPSVTTLFGEWFLIHVCDGIRQYSRVWYTSIFIHPSVVFTTLWLDEVKKLKEIYCSMEDDLCDLSGGSYCNPWVSAEMIPSHRQVNMVMENSPFLVGDTSSNT